MKKDETTILKRNPYQYNGESPLGSPQPKSLQSTSNQSITNNKKLFIESYGCQMDTDNQLLN